MNLLDLMVRVGVEDDASEDVESISDGIIGKLGSAAKTAAKALGAMWATSKVVEFGKAAFDSYSQLQQLEGGVSKLFGDSAQTVMDNAQQAFGSIGVSANEYMQQVTSFSAALINDLGNDTAEAARLSDVAMTSMADNVSIFGSDMQSIQNAYQGFAKQNYTMLDNLKLGYGGTKTEMERLIADANEYAASIGQASDLSIDSFADVVQAIDLIQQKQGIAGNAAAEASKTIEGSLNATKAAWQNLVAEFGKPDADIGARIADMFTAIMGEGGEGGLLRNVTNEVGVIVGNMVGAISNGVEQGFEWLVANGPSIALDAVNGIIDAMTSATESIEAFDLSQLFADMDIGGIAEKVSELFGNVIEIFNEWSPDIAEAAGQLMTSIGEFVSTNGPVIMEKVGEILGNIGSWIVEHGPELVGAAAEVLASIVDWAVSHGPEIVEAIAGIVGNIVEWLIQNGPTILAAAGEMISNIGLAIAEHGPQILNNIGIVIGMVIGYVAHAAAEMFTAAVEFVGGLVNGSTEEGERAREWFAQLPQMLRSAFGNVSSLLLGAGYEIISGLWEGMKSAWSGLTDWISGLGSWIAAHKGPKQYDLALLVPNGQWIMQGLDKGLRSSIPQIQKTLDDVTDMMNVSASFGTSASFGNKLQSASVAPNGGTVYNNYYIDAHAVTDERVASAVLTIVNQAETFREMGVTETGVANG